MLRQIKLFLFALLLPILAVAQQPRLILPTRHTDFLVTFDRSPDGKLFLTASEDKTAQVYKASTGELMGTFTGHTGVLRRANFNSDGTKFLTTAEDSLLLVFDVLSGEEILRVKMDDVSDVGSFISHDDRYVVSADFMYLRFYDMQTGEEMLRFEPPQLFNSVHESPDGRYIVIGTDDNYAMIFDVEAFEVIKDLEYIEGSIITQAKFTADGKWIITASDAGAVQIFNASTFELEKEGLLHSGRVEDIIISDDGHYMMSVSEDSSAVVVDMETLEPLYRFDPEEGGISLGAISSKSKYGAVFGGDDIYIFELATGDYVSTVDNYPFYIAFDVEEKYLVTDGMEEVKYYHVSTGELAMELKSLTDYYMDLEFAPNSYLMRAELTFDELIDIETGKALAEERLPEYFPFTENLVTYVIDQADNGNALATMEDAMGNEWEKELRGASYFDVEEYFFSKDGNYVVLTDEDGKMRLYNTKTGKRIWKDTPPDLGTDIVFSKDNSYMAYVHNESEYIIHLVDLNKGKTVMELTLDDDPDYLGFSADGDHLLLSTWGTSAYVIDARNQRIKRYFNDPFDNLVCLALSADNRYFFTAGWNGVVRMYDMESGEKVLDLNGHNQKVEAMAVSHDNKFLVTCSRDHKMIVWDLQKGEILYTRLAMELEADEDYTGKVDWLVYDKDYRYDGSEAARNLIYMVCGLEVIDLSQMKDALYVPGLAQRIMTSAAINYPKISELEICGNLPIVEPMDAQGYRYKVIPRNLEVERVDVYVNQKRVKQVFTSEMRFEDGGFLLELDSQDLSRNFLAGQENRIEVTAIAKQQGNEVKSRGLGVTKRGGKTQIKPTLFAVMVGINDYRDDDLDLLFPVKDAEELGEVIELSAAKLLGQDHVKVYHVNSNLHNSEVFSTPEKEGVRKALEEIGKQAKAEDVVLIFFAGHGVMQGEEDKQFTLLTAEATSDHYIGISTKDLMSWLSPDGPNKMLANKSILILDACNSGQMTEELLAMARNDDQVRRIKQVEDLKDKSGMFILAASAPNQSAYELPQYGQGLMTYCLLKTLKEDPTILDDKQFLNVQRWFLAAEEELQRLAERHGLNQQATPFGTTNIRIGQVDEDIRSSIVLNTEKKLIICANAFNQLMGFDDLGLKAQLNNTLDSLGMEPDNGLALAKQEEAALFNLNLSYFLSGDELNCKLIVLQEGAVYKTFDYLVRKGEEQQLMHLMVADLIEME